MALGASWRTLAERYHLHRLINEDGYFREAIEEPEGSVAFDAVAEFLESDQGRQAYLDLFLEAYALNIANLDRQEPNAKRKILALFECAIGESRVTSVRGHVREGLTAALYSHSRELIGVTFDRRHGGSLARYHFIDAHRSVETFSRYPESENLGWLQVGLLQHLGEGVALVMDMEGRDVPE